MNQILRIFRKDLRRHWPEILISLLLLALYCWREVRTEFMGMRAYSSVSLIPWLEFVPILLPLAWFLLIVRLVQEESLVGDRQWWITKPYEWPSLLVAKLLFLVVWLGVPLFFAKWFLLRAAGFALAPHLAGLFGNLFGVPVTLFAFCFVLASLTRTLGHMVIVVIGLFLLMTALSSFDRFIPDYSLAFLQSLTDKLTAFVYVAAGLGVVLWQFARRKTVHTRAALLAAIVATWVIQLVTPYRALMERKYPSASPQDQPFHVALRSVVPPDVKTVSSPGREEYIPLRIPLEISRVSQGGFVTVDAEQLIIEDSAGSQWKEAWQGSRQQWWPEDTSVWSVFSVKNPVYQKLKSQPVKLRLEMAVTEYRLTNPREILVKEGEFWVPSLGICGLQIPFRTTLTCRLPFAMPSFVATFDPASAKCPVEGSKREEPPSLLRFVSSPQAGSSGLWINPVSAYTIQFYSPSIADPLSKPVKAQNLCSGDTLALATPVVYRHARMEVLLEPVQMENFRLIYPGQEGQGVSWDLRM